MRLAFEHLEPRQLFSAWQNTDLPCDADGSNLVTATDALIVLNDLSRNTARKLDSEKRNASEPFIDVNGDNYVSPIDALLILNAISRYRQPPVLVASIAPKDDPNFNSVVLSDRVQLSGQTTALSRIRFTLQHQGSESHLTWDGLATPQGSFQTTLPLGAGANTLSIEVRDELGRKTHMTKTLYQGDVVADWNATLLNSVRDWTSVSNDPYPNRIVYSRPPMVTRNLAMVHLAMFDAINAVEGRFEPYLQGLPRKSTASPIAALSTAAHRVAIQIYSDADEVPVLNATLNACLDLVPDGDAKEQGIKLGELVAQRILIARSSDGSSSVVPYTPSGVAGRWNRTSPDLTPPELPMWRNVKPFALRDVKDFRVDPPPSIESSEYAAAVDEVIRIGRLDSTERTADQTEIALFWADGAGTATPPGHWNRIASKVLMSQSHELIESARTMALLNLALADAAIAAWDNKYFYDYWRPLHAINQGQDDSNPATIQDLSWIPLLKTPPHPSYVSGHSAFSAAAAAVLTRVLGGNIAFSSTNDPQSGLTQRPLAPDLVVTRHFANFQQAAQEAGMSRIYGGIHFTFDNTAGMELGRSIGETIVKSWLRLQSAS
jgi:membrane-associated phospholipid phosphatase